MKDRRRGGDQSERWLTTYADMVTLLLAFFVVLFSISEIDPERFGEMISGLEVPFNNPGKVDPIPEPERTGQEDSPPGTSAVTTTTVPEATEEYSVPPLVVDRDELLGVQEELESALEHAEFDEVADFRITERGLVVSIATDDLLFASGSAELGPAGRAMIGAMIPALSEIANTIQIEGHTDNVPYSGGGYDNWDLSTDRALAVLRILAESPSIDPARLGATGYSSHRPLAPNDEAEGRAANRRVELVIAVDGRPGD